eukprot:COSAG01_NODE_8444_length_2783_cov_3.777198_1_plen_147_part_00
MGHLSVAPSPLPRGGRSEGQSESQQGGGARRRTVNRDAAGALSPGTERMAGGGGRYLTAGRCTAGVTIPPISGQVGAEASPEIDPTARRSPDCMSVRHRRAVGRGPLLLAAPRHVSLSGCRSIMRLPHLCLGGCVAYLRAAGCKAG